MRYGLGLGLSVWNSNYLYPSMSLDFLSGSLDPKVTFTRASTATYFGSDGLLKIAAVDVPRFDYGPVTMQPKGMLIEESRTNILLNSATLATQSVTTTAQAYTLTFYGTGSVSLSGAYTGSLAGTGAANRVSLTFTATAGSLTATVTGSVTNAQIEAGSFATSYIPTTGSASTRAADNAVMTGTAFSQWFNPVEGAIVVEASLLDTGANRGVYDISDGTVANEYFHYATTAAHALVNSGGVSQGNSVQFGAISTNTVYRHAFAYKANDLIGATNGALSPADSSIVLPVVNRLTLGSRADASFRINGYLRRWRYYPRRLDNTLLQQLTVAS